MFRYRGEGTIPRSLLIALYRKRTKNQYSGFNKDDHWPRGALVCIIAIKIAQALVD